MRQQVLKPVNQRPVCRLQPWRQPRVSQRSSTQLNMVAPYPRTVSWVKAQPGLGCSDTLQVVHMVLPATVDR